MHSSELIRLACEQIQIISHPADQIAQVSMLPEKFRAIHKTLVMEHSIPQVSNIGQPLIDGSGVAIRAGSKSEDVLGEPVTESCLAVVLVEECGPESKRKVGHDGVCTRGPSESSQFRSGFGESSMLARRERDRSGCPAGITEASLQCLIDAIAKSQFEDLQRRVESLPDRGVEEVPCDQMCWVGAHSWPIRHRPQSSR